MSDDETQGGNESTSATRRVAEAPDDERTGTARVVLLSVQVAFDALPEALRKRLPTEGPVEAWIAVSGQVGTVEEAIQAFSGPSGAVGNTPGKYKAPPRRPWFVSPLVIEPPLG